MRLGISLCFEADLSWVWKSHLNCPTCLSAGGVVLTDDVELVPGNPTTTLTDQALIAAGKTTLTLGIFVSPLVPD